MFVFCTNIMKINNYIQSNYKATFGAKQNSKNLSSVKQLETDTVEFVRIDFIPKPLPKILPNKFELTEAEEKYNEVWVKLKRLEMNIYTQKSALINYYSAQDRLDYRELLKQRQTLIRQLHKIASDSGIPEIILESIITVKKEYNRYAPKIIKAKTVEDFKTAKNSIPDSGLCHNTYKLLDKLFKQQKKIFKI